MIIDLILLGLMIMAVVKGLQRGFVVALFSMIAFIVGLVAALKLSTTSCLPSSLTAGVVLPKFSPIIVMVGELSGGKLNVTFLTTTELGEAFGLILDFTVTAPSCPKTVIGNKKASKKAATSSPLLTSVIPALV